MKLLSIVLVLCLGSISFANEEATEIFPQKKADKSVATNPSKPSITAPAFNETVGANVTLKWESVVGANAYHVQVASDANFKWLVQEDHFVKGTTFEPKGLEAGKKYYWRVSAKKVENDPGYTKGSFAVSSFVTKQVFKLERFECA